MKIPKEWNGILEKDSEIKEMFLEQESIDIYGAEPIPAYFLHYFRPNKYDILKEFFMPFSHGEEIFNRLKMIYDLTADNFENEDGSIKAYFFPKENKTIPKTEVEMMALQYTKSINDILIDLEETSFIDCNELKVITMKRSEFDEKYDYYDTLGCELYDLTGDWFRDLESEIKENPLTFFDEPLYNVACDYDLARYVMWPVVEKNDMNDPYEAYFNLWKYGYKPFFVSNEILVLTY
jgi:hypothetical protein